MPALTDTFTLANDVTIPRIGFGTWQIPNGRRAYDAVAAALDVGYRHIDTARGYGNEASVGRAIAASGIPRSEIFLTSKLPADVKSYEGALRSFEVTMDALGLDVVDLYLIHAPWPWSDPAGDYREGNRAAWRALEELHESGRARSIGVSNFDVDDLDSLIGGSRIVPHVNQVRYVIREVPRRIAEHCASLGILVEGYSPLATGWIFDDREVASVAEKYGRPVAQIAIRYLLERGVLPLPKTTSRERMIENADVDFEIASEDLAFLDALPPSMR